MRYTTLLILLLLASCSTSTSQVGKITNKTKQNQELVQPEVSDRVEALMTQMTLEEKIGQLNLITPGGAVTGEVVSKNVNEKLKQGKVGGVFGIRGAAKVRQLQELAVTQSRLGIPLIIGLDVIHGHQTIFPIPLGLSCTWDTELIERTARTAAREATADGLMWAFSPMVDIARDPRWGRIAEGSGEDPFLGSAIARAMVRGYQGNDLSDPTTLMGCVKHFALYGAVEGGRDYATVDMSRVRMYNEYLPPYQAAIDEGVGSIMTSFNVVDYVPVSGNKFLFKDVLRDQWGFKGFVVTDYTSIMEMTRHGLGDDKEVTRLSLTSGIDMDMVSEFLLNNLQELLDEGAINERDIDNACRRILRAKEELGLFDDPFRYIDEERAQKEILSKENREFAREVASESFVLLKNEDDILPLKKSGTIALVGPLADFRRNMLGTWSVSGDYNKAVTVLEGIKNTVGNQAKVLYATGANISNDVEFVKKVNAFGEEIKIDERSPEDMIAEAVELTKQADVVIAVVGESANMAGEASSLAHIGLQDSQMKLLKALKATGKPIVMVLYNGRPMTLTWEEENMNAILDVWFGGTEGGNAIGDVIFGDVNPSGKLTTSFPVHVGQVPVYHSMLNTGRPNNGTKFRSRYLDIPNDPLFPFGYGLSYTSFEYSKVTLSATKMNASSTIKASVTVTNTGERPGKEIVQLYIQDVIGSISRPLKELKGFKKIPLAPGESKTVTFDIDIELLKFYNSDLDFVAEPGDFKVFIGKNSSHLQEASFTLDGM